jgi:AsmA protein
MPRIQINRVTVTIASIAVLIFAIFALLLFNFHPNKIKSSLEHQVYQLTGKKLTIDGKIKWHFLPTTGLKLKNLNLYADVVTPNKTPLASIDSAYIKTGVLSILNGNQLEISHIKLDGLTINFDNYQDGNNNWSSSNNIESNLTANSTKIKPSIIKSIKIKNAKLNFTDCSSQQYISLNAKHFKLNNLNWSGHAIPLALSATLDSSFSKKVQAIKLKTIMTLNSNTAEYKFEQTSIDIKPFAESSRQGNNIIGLYGSIAWAPDTFNLHDLKFLSKKIKFNANIHATKVNNETQYDGDILMSQLLLANLVKQAGFNLPFKDKHAFNNLNARLQFAANQHNLSIKNFAATVDNSHLSGSANIEAKTPKPKLQLVLNLDKLDLSQYKIEPQPRLYQPKRNSEQNAIIELSRSIPRYINTTSHLKQKLSHLLNIPISSQIHINLLHAFDFNAKNVDANLNFQNNLLNLTKLQATIFDGSINANSLIDFNNSHPSYWLNAKLSQVNLQQLLNKLLDIDWVSATASIDSKLNFKGKTRNEIINSLNGLIKLNAKDGCLLGLSVQSTLDNLLAAFNHDTSLANSSSQNTNFNSLTTEFLFNNGEAKTANLNLQSPTLNMTGAGIIDLAQEQLKLNLKILASDKLPIEFNQLLNLTNEYISLKLRGSLTEPSISYDAALIQKTLHKQSIRNAIDKATIPLELQH